MHATKQRQRHHHHQTIPNQAPRESETHTMKHLEWCLRGKKIGIEKNIYVVEKKARYIAFCHNISNSFVLDRDLLLILHFMRLVIRDDM